MRKLFKSSFFWQFAGGFALGAVGVLTLAPVQAESFTQSAPTHIAG